MPHKFKIVSRKHGQYGVQFLYNSEIMVWSESYKRKSSARSCIDSIKKNAPGAALVDPTKNERGTGYRFDIVKSKNGQFFMRFVAPNGETMVISETYTDKRNAINCAVSVAKNAPAAAVEDDSPNEDLLDLEELIARPWLGHEPAYGTVLERRRRKELREKIYELQCLLDEQPFPGMGHNQPPEQTAVVLDHSAIEDDITRIDAELQKQTPDVQEVVERTGKLQKVLDYAAAKLNITVDAFMKRLGDLLAVAAVGSALGVLYYARLKIWLGLAAVVETAVSWLNGIIVL